MQQFNSVLNRILKRRLSQFKWAHLPDCSLIGPSKGKVNDQSAVSWKDQGEAINKWVNGTRCKKCLSETTKKSTLSGATSAPSYWKGVEAAMLAFLSSPVQLRPTTEAAFWFIALKNYSSNESTRVVMKWPLLKWKNQQLKGKENSCGTATSDQSGTQERAQIAHKSQVVWHCCNWSKCQQVNRKAHTAITGSKQDRLLPLWIWQLAKQANIAVGSIR